VIHLPRARTCTHKRLTCTHVQPALAHHTASTILALPAPPVSAPLRPSHPTPSHQTPSIGVCGWVGGLEGGGVGGHGDKKMPHSIYMLGICGVVGRATGICISAALAAASAAEIRPLIPRCISRWAGPPPVVMPQRRGDDVTGDAARRGRRNMGRGEERPAHPRRPRTLRARPPHRADRSRIRVDTCRRAAPRTARATRRP
jgi:hypothetical protein